MSTRRDFLAFTMGAIAARMVLPLAARAEPDPWRARNELERRFLLMVRQLTDAQQDALLTALQRQRDGMPMLEAMRGFYAELGMRPPADLLA